MQPGGLQFYSTVTFTLGARRWGLGCPGDWAGRRSVPAVKDSDPMSRDRVGRPPLRASGSRCALSLYFGVISTVLVKFHLNKVFLLLRAFCNTEAFWLPKSLTSQFSRLGVWPSADIFSRSIKRTSESLGWGEGGRTGCLHTVT